MQTATQILAQRAPATRTKPRWQPYTSTRSPITTCLSIQSKAQSPAPITPSTSTSQINQPQIDSNLTPATDTQPLKDGNKHKFSIGLIDQAVKTLSEIWRPQDIPRVFLAPTKIGPAGLSLSHSTPSIPSSLSSHRTPTPLGAHSSAPQVLLAIADESDSNLLPIRSFVHEVLKRSRTSGSILQAALCYLEAIRTKVPEILEQERNGIRAQFEPESRIILATEEELKAEADMPSGSCFSDDSETIKTIRVSDYDYEDHGRSEPLLHPSAPNQAEPMFALPSPLLCPRRAFLASLILASKFFQDKCYSNRAWAKLSGLPPREISRCERALGQVLEWRLWVGKKPVATPTTPPPLPAVHRTMPRSHSEGTISVSSIATTSFLAPSETINRVSTSLHISPDATAKGLRRSSTLPDVYATSAAGVSGNVAPIPSIIVESTEDVLMYSSLSMSSHGQLQPVSCLVLISDHFCLFILPRFRKLPQAPPQVPIPRPLLIHQLRPSHHRLIPKSANTTRRLTSRRSTVLDHGWRVSPHHSVSVLTSRRPGVTYPIRVTASRLPYPRNPGSPLTCAGRS
ncbi:hypothetical protein BJ165DRAFT_965957 [Panaeolus papilionaceus]|nr:hypothetical protein BJ165DRAFT_965957 [Panaeolus papilionaceus]